MLHTKVYWLEELFLPKMTQMSYALPREYQISSCFTVLDTKHRRQSHCASSQNKIKEGNVTFLLESLSLRMFLLNEISLNATDLERSK